MTRQFQPKNSRQARSANTLSAQTRDGRAQAADITGLSLQAVVAHPASASPGAVLALQRAYGNQAVQHLMRRTAAASAAGGEVDGAIRRDIDNARGGGQSLDTRVGAQMGHSLGADFSHVKVHTDARADTLNRSLNAEAFTLGRDIFFSRGAYRPNTSSGSKLLAHELTHIVQQGGGGKGNHTGNKAQAKLAVGPADDQYEREADRTADRVVSQSAPVRLSRSQSGIGRQIQRKMRFKPEDLQGKLSKTAKFKGLVGMESTFSKIKKTLDQYWATNVASEEEGLLRRLILLCMDWQQIHRKNAKNPVKDLTIDDLLQAALAERPKAIKRAADERYMGKFNQFGTKLTPVTTDPAEAQLGKLDEIKQAKSDLKHGRKQTDEIGENMLRKVEKYQVLKGGGLSAAERAAMMGYTGEQYRLMNPAMAGNRDWLKSNMESLNSMGLQLDTSPTALDQALAHNQEIARMASSGMKKIPVWKQDQTLYRGETVPQAEGESLGPGKSKKYPHFVSTSLELEAPRRQLNEWATPARPFKIIYHIKSSTTGRNVAPYSQLPQEKEILFPAGSKFVMGQIVQQTADSKEIEASVH